MTFRPHEHKMVYLRPEGTKRLNTFFNSIEREDGLPSFAAGATTADGEMYFNHTRKTSNNDVSSVDVSLDTVYWLCSMTKLITHIAALQLIESGKLDTQTPVADFLPQLRDPLIVEDDVSVPPKIVGLAKTIIRVKHLLDFTSGIYGFKSPTAGIALNPVYTSPYPMQDKYTAYFDMLKGQLPGVPLLFEPGTDFIYGHSSDVLGFIIEIVTGDTLDAYIQNNIFGPLGISGSFYLTGNLKERYLPITYRRAIDGKLEAFANQPGTKIIEQDPAKVLCIGGAGLYMSLRDFLAVLRHLLQILDGKAEVPLLKFETAKSFFVPTLPEKGRRSIAKFLGASKGPGVLWGNAMALSMADWKGARKAGSGYWGGWLGTKFWIDPTASVAGVTGLHLLCAISGFADPDVLKATATFEEILYSSLDSSEVLLSRM